MVLRVPFAGLVVLAALGAPGIARADTGHVGLVAGAVALQEGGSTEWRPYVRTELGLRAWGPFEIGGFVQMATLGFPADTPGFGGGVFVHVRPDEALLDVLVPHLEVAGSRVTLPTSGGRIDAWGLSVGGGLGAELVSGLVVEGRVHHQWYFDAPPDSGLGTDGWTIALGATYRLP